MNKIVTFRDIIVWQKSHLLVMEVYKSTQGFPQSEKFGLSSQMRRCVVSIPSNIAEGHQRKKSADRCHFINIAQSSLEELKYQLLLSHDLGYINDKPFSDMSEMADEVGKLLFGWYKINSA